MASNERQRQPSMFIFQPSLQTETEYIKPILAGVGNRGVIGGNHRDNIGASNTEYITISTTGNGQVFGDLTCVRQGLAAASSGSMGLFAGGYPDTNTVDYVTIATIGNANAFNNLLTVKYYGAACGNSEKAIFAGGYNSTSAMEEVSFSMGVTTTNFGTLFKSMVESGGCCNNVRGLWFGGNRASDYSAITYITMATAGADTDFGNLTVNREYGNACADASKAICASGSSSVTKVIDYVTIATLGNASIFGNLIHPMGGTIITCSSGVRGVFGYSDIPLEYVTFSTLGDATAAGYLLHPRSYSAACSGN